MLTNLIACRDWTKFNGNCNKFPYFATRLWGRGKTRVHSCGEARAQNQKIGGRVTRFYTKAKISNIESKVLLFCII